MEKPGGLFVCILKLETGDYCPSSFCLIIIAEKIKWIINDEKYTQKISIFCGRDE